MNKWVNQFLEKEPYISTDRFTSNPNLSVLSVPHQEHLNQNLENKSPSCTDSTDIFTLNSNLSVLSVPAYGILDKNSFLHLEGGTLLSEYEERLAIAEYDGHQTPSQTQRIAYVDAFVAVLATLPYEDPAEDWLPQRIRATQNWLVDQGIDQPK